MFTNRATMIGPTANGTAAADADALRCARSNTDGVPTFWIVAAMTTHRNTAG